MISVAAFINNGRRCECLLAGIQDKAVQAGKWGMLYEVIRNSTQRDNLFKFITKVKYNQTTKSHTLNTSSNMTGKCLRAKYFSRTKNH